MAAMPTRAFPTRTKLKFVMAGLDPATMKPQGETQPYRLNLRTFIMDCRVKPGHDEREVAEWETL
jgi:hypothetical protein